jgi:hypothetical protein
MPSLQRARPSVASLGPQPGADLKAWCGGTSSVWLQPSALRGFSAKGTTMGLLGIFYGIFFWFFNIFASASTGI